MTSPYVSGDIGNYGLSGNASINPLLVWGYKWGNTSVGTPVSLTYSFPNYGATWLNNYWDGEPFNGFQPFTGPQQQAARQALSLWSEVANVTFTEVSDTASDVGDLRFGNSAAVTNSSSAAWAYLPFDDQYEWPENGDVWFDVKYPPNLELSPGEFGFSTMVHEIGHALGLDHPFADEAGELAVPAAQNNQRYTIMAYNTYSGATIEAYGPMLYDILAIQYLYGANMTTRAGDDVYTFSSSKEYLECIWDAGGHDTIDLSNQTRNQIIDLRAGQFSSIGIRNDGVTAVGNVSIAFNVTIEDAVGGSGRDKITGNGAANKLWGGSGNDTLDGGDGADVLDGQGNIDTLMGGKGGDTYIVDSVSDIVSETITNALGGGIDTVIASASYSIASLGNVENLALANGAGNINATGNAAANTLTGNQGGNVLNGGGGADLLFGGAGNDVYVIDNAGDVVNEQGNADSHDELRSATIRFTSMVAGIEDYSYTGALAWTFIGNGIANRLSGGSVNDSLNGADGNDTLSGNNGNDTLIGGIGLDWLDGGAGNDKMRGGSGNDTYVISAATDVIDEEGNTDTGDTVRASFSIALATLASGAIENATLLGLAAINATGTGGVNTLTGNDGANVLDGGGGADTLIGGKGNDTYVVDTAGDQVIEAADGGVDVVTSSTVSVNLGSFANVENLTLTGKSNINGTGNGLANILTGNDGANTLNGGGGADTLIGGKGDDVYVVDTAGDVINETISNALGGGIDTVIAFASYSIAGLANVENLALVGAAGNINATGNAAANTLTGNEGNNVLDGGGGPDLLFGGAGNDTYLIDNVGDVADEQGNTDTNDELRSAGVVLGAVAGIEHYTYSGAAAWNFTGTSADNKVSGGTGNDALNGADGNDTLSGNGGNDTLIGNIGDDWLDGGAGNDAMKGGAGNDTYVVNDAGDTIDEEGNADSADVVRATVSVNLASFSGGAIEQIILLGANAIDATGNSSANKLTGNDAANTLDGAGGADTLIGGKGNDTCFVDSLSDQIVELAGEGADLIKSYISFDLASVANVENLTLVGDAHVNATGDSSANIITGNDGNNVLNGLGGDDTLIGGKGNDTYVVDTLDTVSETISNALSGGIDTIVSFFSYSIAAMANIDNVTLTGAANSATGNASTNVLIGNDIANILDGGAGADVMRGGAGDDAYVMDNAGDVVDEEANTDKEDSVRSTNVLLTEIAGIEHYYYQGSANWTFIGTSANNIIKGGSGNDTLSGGAGNDVIDGGAGKDKMTGGSGNDTYWVDDAADTIDEQGNTDSADVVFAFASINLQTNGGAGIEDVTLLLNATDATGNSLANTLYGNFLDNLLDGGSGADKLYGGDGNDTFVIDDAGDQIAELSGNDTVKSANSLNLASFTGIENLTLIGTGDFDATGDGDVNVLTGNSGNNVLAGLGGKDILDGGAGSDTLKGGANDDIYIIDDAGDQITDLGGADLIKSHISLSLASFVGIENLTLLGTANIDATGDGLANVITGNDGDNILAGGGGTDTLIGGSGNDTYLVSDKSDVIIETGGGIDTIVSDFDFDLRFIANIESLTLTEAAGPVNGLSDAVGTTGDNTLIGNSYNNGLAGVEGNDRLFGGAGDDSLNGWTGDDFLVGGDGADDLQPGSGRDTLDYNHLSEAGDTIGGFAIGAGGDVLDLHDMLVDIGYAGSNPFADGYLTFSHVGSQTQILVDADGHGAGGSTILTTLFGALTQADTNNYII